jgi:Ca2+-transporting ATPase
MDGPPAVALGIERRHGEVMNKPPRPIEEPLPPPNDMALIGFLGLVMVIGTLAIFSLADGGLVNEIPCDSSDAALDSQYLGADGVCDEAGWTSVADQRYARANTLAFSVFILFQLFNVINCRSVNQSVFKLGLLDNRAISLSFGISLSLLLVIVQWSQQVIPVLNVRLGDFLATTPISLLDWVVILLTASSVLWIEEFRKQVMVVTGVLETPKPFSP